MQYSQSMYIYMYIHIHRYITINTPSLLAEPIDRIHHGASMQVLSAQGFLGAAAAPLFAQRHLLAPPGKLLRGAPNGERKPRCGPWMKWGKAREKVEKTMCSIYSCRIMDVYFSMYIYIYIYIFFHTLWWMSLIFHSKPFCSLRHAWHAFLWTIILPMTNYPQSLLLILIWLKYS